MSVPSTQTRRAALGATGTVVALALAGCPLAFGGTSEEIRVTLANEDDASHRLSVTVAFEGSTLLDREVSLAAGESTSEMISNPDTTGDARMRAAVDGGQYVEADVEVGPGSGIRSMTAEVTTEGTVSVWAGRT